jgi:hypothetical protein
MQEVTGMSSISPAAVTLSDNSRGTQSIGAYAVAIEKGADEEKVRLAKETIKSLSRDRDVLERTTSLSPAERVKQYPSLLPQQFIQCEEKAKAQRPPKKRELRSSQFFFSCAGISCLVAGAAAGLSGVLLGGMAALIGITSLFVFPTMFNRSRIQAIDAKIDEEMYYQLVLKRNGIEEQIEMTRAELERAMAKASRWTGSQAGNVTAMREIEDEESFVNICGVKLEKKSLKHLARPFITF